jgi:hypothetical protein
MATIKSGASTDQLTVDPSSKAARTTLYDTTGVVIAVAQDGTDGATPPSIPGTGIRGWLRAIYDKFTTGIQAFVKRPTLTGLYFASSGILTIQAAAHGATAGFMWLINPIGSGVTLYFRKCNFTSATTTALVTISSPRVTVERMTFTGVSSAAPIAAAKRATSDATPKGLVVLATTGLTPTAGNIVSAFAVVNNQTAVGTTQPTEQIIDTKDDDGLLQLAPGEGLVWRQADAGTASDTRKANIDLKWEER